MKFKICTFLFSALLFAQHTFGMAPLRQRVSALLNAVRSSKTVTNIFSVKKSVQNRFFKQDPRDAHGRTALMLAAQKNDIASIETLIKNGANIDKQDHYRQTALHHATLHANRAAENCLKSHGANPHIRNYLGLTPCAYTIDPLSKYYAFFTFEHKSYWQRFKDFVKNRYQKYARKILGGATGMSVGLYTIQNHSTDNIHANIDAFCKALEENNWKLAETIAPHVPKNLLHELLYAEVKNVNTTTEKVTKILSFGAKVVLMPSGITALHAAAYQGNISIVALLVKHVSHVDILNKSNNFTAAHYAALGGHKHIIEFLEMHGADLTIENKDGDTPLDLL